MDKPWMALVAAACLAVAPTTHAHGAGAGQPKHGGIVQSAGDLGFELVARPDGATLYLDDHDKPLVLQGASGRLTVLDGVQKSEAGLTAAGDNRLEARGVILAPGSKAVAVVTLPGRKVVTVRFALP
jgi:hypothetical protein